MKTPRKRQKGDKLVAMPTANGLPPLRKRAIIFFYVVTKHSSHTLSVKKRILPVSQERVSKTLFFFFLTLRDSVTAKLLQSCPTLCDPIDGSPPGSAVPGILQARILEWVAISSSNA